MNYCKKCESEFEGVPEAKTGFCPACVEAIARGKKQTKDFKSRKAKIAKNPNLKKGKK